MSSYEEVENAVRECSTRATVQAQCEFGIAVTREFLTADGVASAAAAELTAAGARAVGAATDGAGTASAEQLRLWLAEIDEGDLSDGDMDPDLLRAITALEAWTAYLEEGSSELIAALGIALLEQADFLASGAPLDNFLATPETRRAFERIRAALSAHRRTGVRRVSETYDWDRLFHAYGVATDTPAHTEALMGVDETAFSNAMEHLYGAVLHQGTIYPATAPAVSAVAQAVSFWSGNVDQKTASARVPALVGFLDAAGESLALAEEMLADQSEDAPPSNEEEREFFEALSSDDEEEAEEAWESPVPDVLMALAVPALRQQMNPVLEGLLQLMRSDASAHKAGAVSALARWSGNSTPPYQQRVATVLSSFADSATERDDRAAAVLALGTVGADVSGWLADDDPAIRACAALHLPRSGSAAAELVRALTQPEEADRWFDRKPSSFPMHVRFTLLNSLLQRETSFDAILPAAVAIARISTPYTADNDCGPLLRAAFPEVVFVPGEYPPIPENIGAPQRQFLAALVANERLWGTNVGNASLALMRVGLPYDRQGIAALLRERT
ncbi:MAG: hypothetical protein FWE39_01815 [Nocardiaceae bacterium]|nr:hypothetical protein [Nocardiaceae bacterium]